MKEQLNIRKKQPVVTKHKALLAYLLDKDIIKEGEYKWIEHADYKDVEGRDVIGVLPLQLASYAKSVTEIPLNLTPEMRGKELTFEEVEKVAEEPVQYIVREKDSSDGVDYYLGILKSYTDEEYELAYKYYENCKKETKFFKDYDEISKARTIYLDILNAIYAQFDIYNIEINRYKSIEFNFFEISNFRFCAKLIYNEEYEDYENEIHKTETIQMTEFNKASVLKFVDDLMEMCL